MKRIPPKIRLPKCIDNPDQTSEHDFETEIHDRRAKKFLGKRELKMYKAGYKRCWWCGVWADFKTIEKVKKIRKKLIKRYGLEKFKRIEKRQARG